MTQATHAVPVVFHAKQVAQYQMALSQAEEELRRTAR